MAVYVALGQDSRAIEYDPEHLPWNSDAVKLIDVNQVQTTPL